MNWDYLLLGTWILISAAWFTIAYTTTGGALSCMLATGVALLCMTNATIYFILASTY